MADILSIGSSALLAYSRALSTTSHNISNVNTPGYSRQRVELATPPGAGSGSGFVGSGVSVSTVARLTDGLVNTRLLGDASAYARLDVYAGYASRVDAQLSGADTNLAAPLQAFFGAANTLAQNPTSPAARQSLIGSAETLAAMFNDSQAQLDSMDAEIDARVRVTVDDINRIGSALAQLNDRIALAQGQFARQPANDLLDQRDQLLQDLSERISISTVMQDDGSLNVFTAGGQALVLGARSTPLAVAGDSYGSGRLEVTQGGAIITSQLGGGALGGLLDVRREVLDPARRELGWVAAGIAETFNAQHAQGLDAYGELGGSFFTPPAGTALAATSNSGTAAVALGFGDVAALRPDDYDLRLLGSGWQLTSRSTGSVVALTGTGSSSDPLRGAGLELTVSGSAVVGDRFLLQPTAQLAGQMSVTISDPMRVAAASPLRVTAAIGNTGSATAATPTVLDAGSASLLDPVNIEFTSASTYQINGAGSYAYSPGTPIAVNGWSLSLSGTPAAGDRYAIARGASNSGDNANAKALAGIFTRGTLDGGRSTLAQAQTALVADAGLDAQQSALRRNAQSAVLTQARNEREAISGVNLDEEAADLVRFQQAYQAAARVIQVADTLFQTLLQATGR